MQPASKHHRRWVRALLRFYRAAARAHGRKEAAERFAALVESGPRRVLVAGGVLRVRGG